MGRFSHGEIRGATLPGGTFDTETVKARFTQAMRRHVGHDPHHVILPRDAADVSGLTYRQIRTLQSPAGNGATLGGFLALARVLPPMFANEMLAMAGMGGAYHLDNSDANPAHAMTALAERVAMLARHMEDGRQTHDEILEALPEMRALHSQLGAYIAGLQEKADKL